MNGFVCVHKYNIAEKKTIAILYVESIRHNVGNSLIFDLLNDIK